MNIRLTVAAAILACGPLVGLAAVANAADNYQNAVRQPLQNAGYTVPNTTGFPSNIMCTVNLLDSTVQPANQETTPAQCQVLRGTLGPGFKAAHPAPVGAWQCMGNILDLPKGEARCWR